MKEYSVKQLKAFVLFIRTLSEDTDKQFEITAEYWDMIRFLETTCFDPMTFEDWVEANEEYVPVFSVETEDLPLLINDDNKKFAPIISWRLQNGC